VNGMLAKGVVRQNQFELSGSRAGFTPAQTKTSAHLLSGFVMMICNRTGRASD
jgi:hypothetical protein